MTNTTIRRRNGTMLLAILAMIAAVLAVLPAAAAASSSECDDDFVRHDNIGWHVYPTGGDDTANIQCALDEAAAAGPGSKVFLGEGDFYTDWIGVGGFDGKIRGEGYDETVVRPLPGGLDCITQVETFGFNVWWGFFDSHPRFFDMAFDIPLACAEPWAEGPDFSLQDFQPAMVAVGTPPPASPSDCDSVHEGGLRVQNVHATAPFPDFEAPIFNARGAFAAFWVGGVPSPQCVERDSMTGKVRVMGSHIDGFGSPLNAESMVDSKVVFKDNVVPVTDVGVLVAGLDSSTARVLGSEITTPTFTGVLADDCVFTFGDEPRCLVDEMKVRVKNNDITVNAGFTGVLATDSFDFEDNLMNLRVTHNEFYQAESLSGVFVGSLNDARIRHNEYEGLGVFGVLLDGDAGPNNSRIIDNDMTDLVTLEAGILLGPNTSENLVKNNPGATVIDLGTNNDVRPAADLAAAYRLGYDRAAAFDRSTTTWRTWSLR